MAQIGQIIVYIIVFCMALGGIASLWNKESELGKQFVEGIQSIGPVFLSVAGIFAAIPYISSFIQIILDPFFRNTGFEPSIIANSLIAVDMGGYQLGFALADTKEIWITSMITGFMAGATVVYTVPIGLRMTKSENQTFFALGILFGFLSIPIGVLVSMICMVILPPIIRTEISATTISSYTLAIQMIPTLKTLLPLILLCLLIALGLYFIPVKMAKGFSIFGNVIDAASRIILILCIIEYFTGLFSKIFGVWGFDPIMADNTNPERALEIVGFTSLMLSGAYPMVYLLKKYGKKPIAYIGRLFQLSDDTSIGILASAANTLTLFPLLEHMKPEDQIQTLAFSVCGAFLIGDHLSFMANFQPNLILPLLIGKMAGGILAVFLSRLFCRYRLKKFITNNT